MAFGSPAGGATYLADGVQFANRFPEAAAGRGLTDDEMVVKLGEEISGHAVGVGEHIPEPGVPPAGDPGRVRTTARPMGQCRASAVTIRRVGARGDAGEMLL
jgi:hypothetical protein